MFLTAKGGNNFFEAWDVEDGMGGSSLKYRFVLECFERRLKEFGSLLHDPELPGDLVTIALWNIVSIRFRCTNFAIKNFL